MAKSVFETALVALMVALFTAYIARPVAKAIVAEL
jgi:hypothetical protein